MGCVSHFVEITLLIEIQFRCTLVQHNHISIYTWGWKNKSNGNIIMLFCTTTKLYFHCYSTSPTRSSTQIQQHISTNSTHDSIIDRVDYATRISIGTVAHEGGMVDIIVCGCRSLSFSWWIHGFCWRAPGCFLHIEIWRWRTFLRVDTRWVMG